MSKDIGLATSFIELVKSTRESKGYTIEQLAEQAGVHRTTIGLLERNERTPTLQVASQISSALGIPLSEMIHESEMIEQGLATTGEVVEISKNRVPSKEFIRNEDKLFETIGITGDMLLKVINSTYQTLDVIDEQLVGKGAVPMSQLVELANLSSMIGNLVGSAIAEHSDGCYSRNKPHTYPDLLPIKKTAANLELKMALETNKPKGHLPKPGVYITFRYILGDKKGNYSRGKENRGDTAWIWEVKVGELRGEDFSCSNTAGDSGKTAVFKTPVFNEMYLVYYVPKHLPYAPKANGEYVGFN